MGVSAPREFQIRVSESAGTVSALLQSPSDAECLLVLAHGAGAGMRHRFLQSLCNKLEDLHIATLRYQFPYMEQGKKRPDQKPVIFDTIRAAVDHASRVSDGLPLFAGGKSFGGRMTSNAAAEKPLDGVRGIVFVGFPLHLPGKPGIERANHLNQVTIPMLFLQGTKDEFADLTLLKPVCKGLGKMSTLHLFEGADHSFHVPKKSGKTDAEVMDEVGSAIQDWIKPLIVEK